MPRELRELLALEIGLERLSLVEVSVPHRQVFRSAIGSRHRRRALLVLWTDPAGDVGVGECSCREDPYFSGEFVAGAREVLARHVFPLLPRQGSVREFLGVGDRVRGWPFAVAALSDALFDLLRRKGSADPLAAWSAPQTLRVPIGLSLGIFDSTDEAVEAVGAGLRQGYRRVKLKVSPTFDPAVFRAVREAFPDAGLGLDANGSFQAEHFELLRALSASRPLFLEQPFPPRRLDLTAELKGRLPDLRICLDESVGGVGDLAVAHRLGALDELNLKPGRVGGQLSALEVLDHCEQVGLPVWIGGMFETGIGRAAGQRLAARLTGARGHDLRPARGYLEADLVHDAPELDGDGTVAVPEDPVALDEAALQSYRVASVELEKS